MILKPCQSLHIKFWFFSGHFNLGQPRFVKKFDTIWAMDVGVPCLNLANCPWPHFGWIKAWTHPFTDLVSVKFQISWLGKVVLCLNDQKKKYIWFGCLYRASKFSNKFRYAWQYQRKRPFLTSVLIIIKSNEVNK